MWGLDHKESWVPKNWYFWTVVLEKTLESPLNIKEIKSVNSQGNQSWIFIGRTDAETETLILWPPDAKYWLIGKDPDTGKDRRQEKKGTTEDEMVGWHHWLNGYEVWASSKSWWWTGEPGVLQSMELQRVEHDWAIGLNWGLGQEMHKISLEYLVPENKTVLKTTTTTISQWEKQVKGTQSNGQNSHGQSWNNRSNKVKQSFIITQSIKWIMNPYNVNKQLNK